VVGLPPLQQPASIISKENRIEKSVKLHIFMLYNLLGHGISFYRKLMLKENQTMKKAGFIIDQ